LPVLHPIYWDANGGIHGSGYQAVWPLYVGQFVRTHSIRAGRVAIEVPDGQAVQEFEELTAGVVEGWQ
jgi:hypothetical protein